MRLATNPYPDLPPDPVSRPAVIQRWESLTFLHWRYPEEAVRAILPSGLEVDVFDGSAWVALVPFRMVRVRPPWAPPLGPLTTFPETNVRTYVRNVDGEPGVWFMSLDITRLLGVVVARTLFHVPYCWASMSMSSNESGFEYRAARKLPGRREARSHVQIRVEEPASRTDLTRFLTNRWRAYTTSGGRVTHAPVAHEPWPLHDATVISLEDELIPASGLVHSQQPALAHFSPGVSARVGALSR